MTDNSIKEFQHIGLKLPTNASANKPTVNILNAFLVAKYSQEVNLLGLKLVYSTLFLIQKSNLYEISSFEVTLEDLSLILGITIDSYKNIREVAEVLAKSCLEIPSEKKDVFIPFFAKVTAQKEYGKISFIINDELKKYYCDVRSAFVPIHMLPIALIESRETFLTYLLLKSQFDKTHTFTIGVKDLRKFFGYKISDYRYYANFRIKILNKIKIQLERSADLKIVDIIENKTAQKVTSLTFNFTENKEYLNKKRPPLFFSESAESTESQIQTKKIVYKKPKTPSNKFTLVKLVEWLRNDSGVKIGSDAVIVNVSTEDGQKPIIFDEDGHLFSSVNGKKLQHQETQEIYASLFFDYKKNEIDFFQRYSTQNVKER